MIVRHIEWGTSHWHGRVGVCIMCGAQRSKDWIEFKTLSGSDFPARGIARFLDSFFPGERWSPAEPYRVEYRRGLSGCVDLWIRVLRSEIWRDAPIIGSIHVSQTGRLNRGLRAPLWVVDTLIQEFPEYLSWGEFNYFIIHTPRWTVDDFIHPGLSHAQGNCLETPVALLEASEKAAG